MLLGALVPLHVQRAWRSRRNRVTGPAMLAFNGAVVVTSFGLYYAGSEALRPWMSNVHIGVGLCLPILLLIHIVMGRRSTPRLQPRLTIIPSA
jgi:cyanate permease